MALDLNTLPPFKAGSAARKRAEHQQLRWRLMHGQGEQDVRARLRKSIGKVREEKWGPIDMSSNPMLSTAVIAATLYSEAPSVLPPEGPGAEIAATAAEVVADLGWWQVMQRVQRNAVALREIPVLLDWDHNDGPALQAVEPFLIEVEVHARHPDIPVAVTRWDRDPDHPDRWIAFRYDPRDRIYEVRDASGANISDRVLGGSFNGASYPWLTQGGPILPWVTHRAQRTGWYWDSWTLREAVEGTLQLGVLYSFYNHLVRAASWAQRYAIGAEPMGLNTDGEDGEERQEIEADPAALLMLRQQSEATTATVGQWQPAADPERILASIRAYERRLVDMMLGSANVSRSQSDIRSGYSLAVSREDQRELQRSFRPTFKGTDEEMLGKVSALLGGPAKGWRVEHVAIPKGPQEQAAEMDRISRLVELGLLDRVSAYQELHPGLNRSEATKAVAEIAGINQATGSGSSGMDARALAEALQKIYLSVGTVITPEEAREILNRAGAGLDIPGPIGPNDVRRNGGPG